MGTVIVETCGLCGAKTGDLYQHQQKGCPMVDTMEPIVIRYSVQMGKRTVRHLQMVTEPHAMCILLKKLINDPTVGRITVEKQH